MNENVKAFLSFVAGAVISGIAVYIWQDKRLSKKFEEELIAYKAKGATEETEKKNVEEQNVEDSDNESVEATSNIPQDAIEAVKRMQEGARKAKETRENNAKLEKSKTNYSSLTRKYGSIFNKNNDKGEDEMTLSEKMVNNRPYYISSEEFVEMDGKDGYTAYDLFYNSDDNSLCNDDGEVIEDGWIMIGWDILQDLYDKKEEECYVRNDNLKEVYCISKNFML